jgi:sulfonate transport system substrate-binding protein
MQAVRERLFTPCGSGLARSVARSHRNRRFPAWPRWLIGGLAAFVLGCGLCRAEPVRIRAGWVAVPASLLPILFAEPSVAKHQGSSYVLEPVFFSASPAMISALAGGDLDLAALGYSSFSLAVLNAGISDLRIVADEIQDGVSGYHTNPFVVRRDSPIQRIEDLKGRVVATNGLGSGVDIAMRSVLAQHGLRDRRDYTTVEVRFGNMKAMLLEGKADLVVSTPPFTYEPDFLAGSRTLFEQKDAFGASELSFWTMRTGFIGAHRTALLDFMEDALRAMHWYLDPAHRQAALGHVARFTRQPVERLAGWVFTERDYYRNPDGLPDLAALARNIEAQRALGLVRAGLDPVPYADLSLMREAGERVARSR